jgi:hypothetical protein
VEANVNVLKAYFTAKAYEWAKKNIRLVDRTDDQIDTLTILLQDMYNAGKDEGHLKEAEVSKEKSRLKQMHDAASHADWCINDEGCLGQCRVR